MGNPLLFMCGYLDLDRKEVASMWSLQIISSQGRHYGVLRLAHARWVAAACTATVLRNLLWCSVHTCQRVPRMLGALIQLLWWPISQGGRRSLEISRLWLQWKVRRRHRYLQR